MLFIKTDTRELTINNENGEKYFDAILSMMLEERKLSAGGVQKAQDERPAYTKEAGEAEEGFRGFLHLTCSRCGRTKTFYAKEKMTVHRCCDCGKETELKEMRRAYTSCECDQDSFYLTNSTMPVLKIPCVRCGADVPVEWNAEKKCYETIRE